MRVKLREGIRLYAEGKVDSVYIVYNEFKSVIAQRLVVDDVLPIRAIGETCMSMAEEVTGEERTRRLEAAAHARTRARSGTTEMDKKAAGFATRRLTISMSSRRQSCSAICCRATFRRSCSAPCWSQKPRNMRRA